MTALAEWQQQVVNEEQDRGGELSRLRNFIRGDIFPTLTPLQQDLLTDQAGIMQALVDLLQARIRHFHTQIMEAEAETPIAAEVQDT